MTDSPTANVCLFMRTEETAGRTAHSHDGRCPGVETRSGWCPVPGARRGGRISGVGRLALWLGCGLVAACGPKVVQEKEKSAAHDDGALLRVGSIAVGQADLDRQLKDKHVGHADEATRKLALEELAFRAQYAQAALDTGLDRDPVVRAEFARILATRLKEQALAPHLKELSTPLSEARLRELYQANEATFRSKEKRQVAVLWLNPGGDPEREKKYQEKLTAARDWLAKNEDLKAHPEQGFSVLGIDYSEHAASRYKGGVVGWLEREGGMDAWSKALAEIVFSLKDPGEVSEVISRAEGVFLVRFMALQSAVLRPFEAVSGELDRAERQRLRDAAEKEFEAGIKDKHPVQWPGQ